MLSEALDAVDAKEYDIPKAAAALACSSSQLIRFVARIPEALEWLNAQRQARGMHKLHS